MTEYGLLSPDVWQSGNGLLNYNPKEANLKAVWDGLGLLGSRLIAGGGPSTDPNNLSRNVAEGLSGFSEARNQSLADSRARAFQDMQVADMQRQRQREEQTALARDRFANVAAMGGKDMAGNPVNMQGLLAGAFPDKMAEMQIGAMSPQKPLEVSPGATLVNPKTMQALYTAPGQNKPTSLQQNLQAAGLKPGDPRYQEAILASLSKPGVAVNLGGDESVSKQVLARYEDANSRNTTRRERLRGLESMMNLAGNIQSGFGADTKLEAQKLFSQLGFNVDMSKVASAEQFRTLAMDRIMEHVANSKGAISEKEMDAFERASPSLANTPEGNKLILKAAIEAERRAALVDDFLMRTTQQNPEIGLFELDRKVSDYRRQLAETPVFTPEEMSLFQNPQATASPQYQPGNGGLVDRLRQHGFEVVK